MTDTATLPAVPAYASIECKCDNCQTYGTKGPAMMEAGLANKDATIADLQERLHELRTAYNTVSKQRDQFKALAIKSIGGLK